MAENLGSIIGNSVGEAAAFAAGIAIGPLLAPLLRALENETWSQYPDAPLAPQTVAQGVTEGKVAESTGAAEAKLTGISPSRFQTLVDVLSRSPSLAQAFDLIRRGQMQPTELPLVIQRLGLEPHWQAFLDTASSTGLQPWETPVPPADLALGLIRGNLQSFDASDGPAFPTGLSSEGSNVPPDPVLGLDVVKEAAASGLDADRMALLARNVGLPPGVVQGLQMLNRGIINEAAFGLLIEQSDARLSWGPFLLELRRMILTPHNYAELQLRGYITQDERDAGAALSGMEPADTQLLYDVLGRSIPVHQITTGLARGGTYDGPTDQIPAEYLSSLERGNLRPEYYNLAYANRYSLPSAFVLKALATAGDLTLEQTETLLLQIGWPPDLAATVAKVWVPAGAGTASPAGKTATSRAVAAVQKAYVQTGLSQSDAESELTRLGEDPTTFPGIFQAWDVSRTAFLQGLSNVQIRNRYRNLQLTEADALAILEGRGLTAADAQAYLTSAGTPPAA